jgi:hypothetical protein
VKCQTCQRGWPVVRVDVYVGASASVRLCDDCLWAEIPQEPAVTVVYPSGATSEAEHYVRTYRPY